jgi:hypothetical protein
MKEDKKQYEIIISPEAENELNISKEFYESKQEGLGKDFVGEVDNTINDSTLKSIKPRIH